MRTRTKVRIGVRSGFICSVALCACALTGCGGGGGNDAAGSDGIAFQAVSGDSKLTPADREAAEFVRSKIEACWVHGPDGWTTELQVRNLAGQVVDRVPDLQFHQFREFKFTIAPERITEAQRLNGADYRGVAEFDATPQRFYRNVANFEGPQGWTPWQDGNPAYGSLAVERRNGTWLIQSDEMFDGIKPKPGTVPVAK